MSITLKHLQVFNAVVVAGSISKAGRHVGLSQPTISQQLAKLEEALGTQLILRTRSPDLHLTPAGEYWFRTSNQILGELQEAQDHHNDRFCAERVQLRFGTTPSLRGRFIEAASRIAVEQGSFTRFEFVWGLNSAEIVEMIDTHRIDCAVISEASVQGHRSELHVVPLFDDKIVWLVPRTVPEDAVAEALATRSPVAGHEALGRYADTGALVPWRGHVEEWYRTRLPFALPFFGCQTHAAAVDIVAAGLCTAFVPLSLLHNLTHSLRHRVQAYDIDAFVRKAVFVMRRHLQSLRPFAEFHTRLCDFVADEYNKQDDPGRLLPLPGLARPEGAGGLAMGRATEDCT